MQAGLYWQISSAIFVAAPKAEGQPPSFDLGHLETSGVGDGYYWVEATHLAHGGLAGFRIRFRLARA